MMWILSAHVERDRWRVSRIDMLNYIGCSAESLCCTWYSLGEKIKQGVFKGTSACDHAACACRAYSWGVVLKRVHCVRVQLFSKCLSRFHNPATKSISIASTERFIEVLCAWDGSTLPVIACASPAMRRLVTCLRSFRNPGNWVKTFAEGILMFAVSQCAMCTFWKVPRQIPDK